MLRAREGGFCGGLFGVFIPVDTTGAPPAPEGPQPDRANTPLYPRIPQADAERIAWAQISIMGRLVAASGGGFRQARSVAEIEKARSEGAFAAVLHLEGAGPIRPDLSNLEDFLRAGVRSVGLVWARANAFAEGVPLRFPHSPDTGPGLTDAGRALVRALRDAKVLVDVSHLNQKGFYEVAEIGGGPVVATHSNAHAICPAARNLTDAQLSVIRQTGGLVGVCFNANDLRPDGQKNMDTPLEVIADHAAYLAEHLGADHVGIGSDFDGCNLPLQIGSAAGYPRLAEALRRRGFNEVEVRGILWDNWLRTLRAVWGEK